MKPPYAIGSVPSLSGYAIAYRWRSLPRVRRHRASKPQGSSERVLPWQITMDQLIFASLSHTHYWYEVGMLKVPAVCVTSSNIKDQSNTIIAILCAQYIIPVLYRGQRVHTVTYTEFREIGAKKRIETGVAYGPSPILCYSTGK